MVEADRYPQVISAIFNTVSFWIHEKYGDLVRSLEHPLFLARERQEEYADAVYEKGCPFDNVTHFVDGTCIRICRLVGISWNASFYCHFFYVFRPSVHQERWYCGHHGHHCFKCMVVQLPNGTSFGFGPFSGNLSFDKQTKIIIHFFRVQP